MFIFNPFMRTFGVTSADYTSFDPSLTYEEISNHVCEEFRCAMRTYCQDNGQEFPMEFNDNININNNINSVCIICIFICKIDFYL